MEIYEVVVRIPGDPTVGIYDSVVRIVYEDGYAVETKADEKELIETTRDFIMNTHGDCGSCHLFDYSGNEVWIK